VRPTRDETCMSLALMMSMRSTCSRLQVGAVIAREGRALVSGYNGAPKGMPHCSHECNCGYPGEGGKFFEGKHLSDCASASPCTVSVHAEANAVAFAARWGIPVEGADLFTTHSPCLACAQLLINCGLTRIVYGRMFRDTSGLDLLISAGLEVVDGKNMFRYNLER
jgi:dCMP deaminase